MTARVADSTLTYFGLTEEHIMKHWYQSKTVWGGAIALLSAIAGAFGYALGAETQEALVASLTAIGGGVGGVLAIYGRIKAEGKIQ
jgi:hypothetical protein